jgi:hypothetical protein
MVVLGEIGSICVEDEREAFVAVNFRESAIDGDCLMASLDWRLALLDLDGHVSVDDEASFRIHTEIAQNLPTELFLVNQLEIRVLCLHPGLFLCDEVIFEGGDFILAEKRRERSAPQIPEHIQVRAFLVPKGSINHLGERIKKCASLILNPRDFEERKFPA